MAAAAAAAAPAAPQIAIVIDDLGNRASDAERVAALPGPVACSILPGTPYAAAVDAACAGAGKVVMLHLPMESRDPTADPGPGGLTLGQTRRELERRLDDALAQLPHVAGVNNHMGSALTARVGYMHWLMSALASRGLWFVDSYTTAASVAADSARLSGVAVLRRDVFLDNDTAPQAIAAQWELLLDTARRDGRAVAIGHPHPATLAALEAALPGLAGRGFSVVSPADMIAETTAGESP